MGLPSPSPPGVWYLNDFDDKSTQKKYPDFPTGKPGYY